MPLDVGFGPSVTGRLIRLTALPLYYVRRFRGEDLTLCTSRDPVIAAEELAAAGYAVVAFETSTGRDACPCCPALHLSDADDRGTDQLTAKNRPSPNQRQVPHKPLNRQTPGNQRSRDPGAFAFDLTRPPECLNLRST